MLRATLLTLGLLAALSVAMVACGPDKPGPMPLPAPGPTTIADMTPYLDVARCPDGKPQVVEACDGAQPQTMSDPITWSRHDWGNPPNGYMAQDGAVMAPGSVYLTTWSFSPDFWPFSSNGGNGGEVYVVDGPTVRISATQDGGKNFLQGFYGLYCGGSGWVAFRNDAPTGSWASVTAWLSDYPIPSTCVASSAAYTRYRREMVAIPFIVSGVERSITIDTVVTEHYDDTTIQDSTDMERSFFAYGVGRAIWEAWSTSPPDPSLNLAERCPGTTYSVAPAPGWYLNDCRYETNIVPGPGQPLSAFGWPPAVAPWP